MKKTLRSLTALLLALTLSTASLTAAASNAMGDDLTSVEKELNYSTALNTNVFWSSSSSDLRTENLITYIPNTAVTPIVTYGSVITERSTVSSMAQRLESQGYRVVAGINGDFYNTGNGVPIGLVMTEGVIRTGAAAYHAIGFRSDGSAILGKPSLSISADLGLNANGESVIRTISDINKARVSTGGIYLYDSAFNSRHTTGSTEPGVDVLCSVVEGTLTIGGTMTLSVDQVIPNATAATTIPEGQYVLSCNDKSNAYYTDALRNLAPGQTITVSVTGAPGWEDVQYAVGALYSLVENGSVVSGLPSGANPRTAIGQKADGTLVFYTMDGRKSGYSIGASMTQIASRLVELGCVTALCLDGGGSTTLSVTQPDAYSASLVNRPSDKAERAVTNQVFLVATNQPSGVLDHLYVAPENHYVLAGSSVVIHASGVDTNYIPMSASDFTLSTSDGTVQGNVLTTPTTGGEVTVTASQDGSSGSAVIHAITTPDSLTISDATGKLSNLIVAPGETVALTGSAIYNHLTLACDAGAFTWSVTGDIGTVDAKGSFTAAATPGKSGTLTMKAGEKSVSIPVQVSTLPLEAVEDFETAFAERTGAGTSLSRNTDAEYVRYGRASSKLAYDLTSGSASLPMDYSFRPNYDQLTVWVYGDESGVALSVNATSPGEEADTTVESVADLGVVDFKGWKQMTAKLPAGTVAISGLTLRGSGSGTLYLDQLTLSYNDIVDTAPPVVTASLSGATLTATVKDAVDGVLPKSSVSVTFDGHAQDFTYNEATGALTASAVTDGAAHRLTVTAIDGSGNTGRASVDVPASSTESKFTDTKGYWASSYVDFLYTSGVTTGYSDGTFRPGNNISRQEFAVMLYRFLDLDGSKYEDVTLPFADNNKIGAFAQTAIKTLYTCGILNGSTGSDGKLYFNPASSITRAQAAAMIGRTQAKGYAAPALTFTDSAKIPSYATYYVSTLTAQGVIGGFSDGSFRPNDPISRGQMAKILYNLL